MDDSIKTDEQMLLAAIAANTDDVPAYMALADLYRAEGRDELADYYQDHYAIREARQARQEFSEWIANAQSQFSGSVEDDYYNDSHWSPISQGFLVRNIDSWLLDGEVESGVGPYEDFRDHLLEPSMAQILRWYRSFRADDLKKNLANGVLLSNNDRRLLQLITELGDQEINGARIYFGCAC